MHVFQEERSWLVLEREKHNSGSVSLLRLFLDVKTRWGSTLYMIRRYLKIRSCVDAAVAKLYAEQFLFGKLRPSLRLSTEDVHALESYICLLMKAESVTALLGVEKKPSLYVHDFVLALVIITFDLDYAVTPLPRRCEKEFLSDEASCALMLSFPSSTIMLQLY